MRALHPDVLTSTALEKRHGEGNGGARTGMCISTSDVGQGGLNIEHYMEVLICTNGMMGERTMRQIHSGKKQEELGWMSGEARDADDRAFWLKARDLIRSTFSKDMFQSALDAFDGTDAVPMERPIEAVDNVVEAFDLTDEDKQAVIDKLMTGSSTTAFDLIQAVTARAGEIEDPNETARLQRVGTEMVDRATELVKVRS